MSNSDLLGVESGAQDVAAGKGRVKSKDRMTQLMEVQEAKLVSTYGRIQYSFASHSAA